MIRLLIADDSALMRKLLEGIFREEGDFDIRLARNGAEALELVRSFDPQVVTLDVQMPGMDGLACLGRIMLESPRPVVMISALTEEGAEATLEAIELGAIDFIAKPGGAFSLEIDRLRPTLLEKVRGGRPGPHPHDAAADRTHPPPISRRGVLPRIAQAGEPRPPGRSARPIDPPGLVLIGTSTGGPAALDIVPSATAGGISLACHGGASTCPPTSPARLPSGWIGNAPLTSSRWIGRCRCSRYDLHRPRRRRLIVRWARP